MCSKSKIWLSIIIINIIINQSTFLAQEYCSSENQIIIYDDRNYQYVPAQMCVSNSDQDYIIVDENEQIVESDFTDPLTNQTTLNQSIEYEQKDIIENKNVDENNQTNNSFEINESKDFVEYYFLAFVIICIYIYTKVRRI